MNGVPVRADSRRNERRNDDPPPRRFVGHHPCSPPWPTDWAIANYRAQDANWAEPIWQARRDGIDAVEKMLLAAIALADALGAQLHGDATQVEADRLALAAGAYEERQREQ